MSFNQDEENETEHCAGASDIDVLNLWDKDCYGDYLQIHRYVRAIQICTRYIEY